MKRVAKLLTGVAAIALPGAALAETPPARGPIDDIIVTASPLGRDTDGTTEADAAAIARSHAVSIADQLARTAPGVAIAEVQGNPLQPDVSFRGFTASPLLGTPQGLSVYLDGVRINQPMGDIVSWDLIPSSAIRGLDLVSGAAPQFGRNALGGALVVRTKDGRSDPGFMAEASGGSYGRATATVQAGGATTGGFHWFALADHFSENGWRPFSDSRADRAFAKAGWSDARTEISLSGLFADTDLNGNGLQEARLLAADRSSIYSAPDNTRNRAWQAAFNAEHHASDTLTLRGNLFWRHLRATTYNGDINDGSLGENLYQPNAAERAALTAAGYSGFPTSGENQANTAFPKWRCIANVLLNDEPNEKCDALVNRSQTVQSEWGASAELAWQQPVAGLAQTLTLGASWVSNRAHFTQSTQFGYLLPDRTVVAVDGPGAFADGTQDSENAFDARVDLTSRTRSLGLYALESVTLTPRLRLDVGGRYDRTSVHNRDGITPGGGPGSLDSDPVFARFNPSASLAFAPAPGVELGLSWSQASRAPSATELGCSDPANPCRLPNALAGDPPLRQVIARSVELRAAVKRRGWSVSGSLFRTDASDDILFVTDDPSGYGYFRNFGKTRRQGAEIDGKASLGRVTLSASYTFLDATYRSAETVDGSSNSSNDAGTPGFDGNIAITPGDHIPLVPRHLFKAAVGWEPLRWLSLDVDMVAQSGVWARGNENNQHQADGTYYLGAGRTAPFAVMNLSGEIRPIKGWTVFFAIRNLLDKDYATAAQLGATAFDASGRFMARPFSGPVIDGERPLLHSTFYAPGAPRTFQLGLRVKL